MALAAGLAACEPVDLDDGGGGGGGGDVLFTRGFVFVREDRNVYVVDDRGDANDPQRLTTDANAFFPAVSPNGRSVVYVYQNGANYELRTVPTDGSAAPSTVFASDSAGCPRCTTFRYPTFNPSGTVIAFSFNRGSGNFSIGRVNSDGSGFQELTPNPTLSYGAPSFFPDGQSVLAPAGSISSQLRQLVRVNINSGAVTDITNNLGNEVFSVESRAVVSPDGQQVALDGRLGSGATRIFVGPLSPYSPPTRITDHPGEPGARDSFPSWMNSTQVGFLSNAGGLPSIYRTTVGTTVGSGTLVVPAAAEPSYGGT